MTHFSFKDRVPLRNSKFTTVLVAALTASVLLPMAATAAPTAKQEVSIQQGRHDWAQVEALVSEELQRVVDKQERIEGQSKYVRARAIIDLKNTAVTIHLDGGYVPKSNGAEFEDLQSELMTTALEVARPAISLTSVDFRFDGRPTVFYFPEDAPPPPAQKESSPS